MIKQHKPISSRHTVRMRRVSQDKGTEERWSHATRVLKHIPEQQALVAYVQEQTIIDILYLNKLITHLEKEAALRFHHDFLAAGLEPRSTASYRPYTDGGTVVPDRNEREEAAYQRWREAMAVMTGAINGVVESVVCYEQTPAPEKVAFLRVGLKKLIKLYGISGCDAFLNDKINQATAGQVGIRRSVSRQSSRRV